MQVPRTGYAATRSPSSKPGRAVVLIRDSDGLFDMNICIVTSTAPAGRLEGAN